MADKTVKELAAMTKKTVEAINNQLVKAGLSARGDNDIVTDSEQQKLVSFLQQSHGQNDKPRISLKSKTTSTARVTGTSGKAKSVNVEVRKKMVFDKPNPNKIAEELALREAAAKEAEEKARLAKEKAAQEQAEKDKAKQAAEARQQATLAAMRANLGGGSQAAKEHTTTSVVVKKGNKTAAIEVKKADKKPAPKKESDSERKAREAEEERLRQIESENRRKAAEEAQQRTLEQMLSLIHI
jgi:translation initiation factor IF-2